MESPKKHKKRIIRKIEHKNISNAALKKYTKSLKLSSHFSMENDAQLIIEHNDNVNTKSIDWQCWTDNAIYIEQGRCVIKDISTGKNVNVISAPLTVICFGGKNYTIESDQEINSLEVAINSKVDNYTLKIKDSIYFAGTITEENAVISVNESSLLLKDGTLLTLNYLRALMKDFSTVPQAKNYIKTAKLEFKEIYEKTSNIIGAKLIESLNLSKFFDLWEDEVQKLEATLIAQDYINSKNKGNNLTSIEREVPASNNYNKIISQFRSYQTDLVKMMERPALSNFKDQVVKDFHLLCLRLERNEVNMCSTEFESEWLILLSHADMQKASHFSKEQSQRFNDSKDLLSKAFNEESTDNEKELSIKALERKLVGVLPVNETLLSNLKQQVGLKEVMS